jgi:hypothetical protein
VASYARVDAPCWTSGHSVAAHELTHNLGGVQKTARNATRNGHCSDESDLMCYDDKSGTPMRKICAPADEQLLDCRNDDYFNTRPAAGTYLARSWNTASSSFLDKADPLGPAPRATVVVPALVKAARAFPVSVRMTVGKGPYTYAWTAGTCRVSSARLAAPQVTCPARRTTRNEVVAVVVRQADGQTVRATRTVQVPRS